MSFDASGLLGLEKSMRPASLKSASDLGANKPHGNRIRYMGGCKCMLCRAANSRYETARAALRRQGLSNGIVSAERVKRYLIKLSKMGIGLRAVYDASGVNKNIIRQIKKGTRAHIRENTERRILAITISAAKNGAIINARPILKLVARLLRAGYTKRRLAQMLNYKSPALQFDPNHTGKIKVKNAIKILRLYKWATAE